MHSGVAATLIQLVCHRQAKERISSALTRWQMGMTLDRVKKKKVIFGNDCYRESPFAAWWILINKPATANRVLLRELKGVILAHVNPVGHITGAIGGPIASAHSAVGTASDVSTVGSMLDGSLADATYSRWADAWKAGTWSAAKGTRQEFAIGLGYFLLGGYCTIAEPDEDGMVVGRTSIYNDKDHMMLNMAIAEREGGLKYALGRLNSRFGWNFTKDFRYTAKTNKLEFF